VKIMAEIKFKKGRTEVGQKEVLQSEEIHLPG
jgi:hypothetical protein